MYAVVEIAGQQFKVEKDQKVYVNRLEGKEGSKISFDNILMLDNSGKIVLGNPVVKGASVEAKMVKHLNNTVKHFKHHLNRSILFPLHFLYTKQ